MGWENNYWVGDEPTVAELVRIQELDADDVACDCCRYPYSPGNLKVYRLELGDRYDEARRDGNPPHRLLCDMCASTMLGTYASYPEQHDRDALEMMKMIAYGVNRILDALEGR